MKIWGNVSLGQIIWTASSEFGTYRLCEQRRFRRACASVQSRQNLRCSLIQAVSHEEPSDRKPDHWPLWMAGHAQLKFVMTECSKTQIRLTGLIFLCDELLYSMRRTKWPCNRIKLRNGPKNSQQMVVRPKEITCVLQVSALKKLGMVGRSA